MSQIARRSGGRWRWAVAGVGGVVGGVVGVAAAATEVASLPAPSSQAVDFARDIQPVLERSCLRCHGPERPKGGLRLDRREAALKGGNGGAALVPGDSAASPLLRYVARLPSVDPELWMPPEGKAPVLSVEEVALFRAWVDQGLVWPASEPAPRFQMAISPMVGGTTVEGNERVYREHRWVVDGWNGGAEEFSLRAQLDDRSMLVSEGHAWRDDYRLTLGLNRREVGFVEGGFQRYRKHYGDGGGYVRDFDPAIYGLDRDLHLDLERAWVDFGLTLPHWPRLTLGYEHEEKDGEKSLTSWSPVTQGGLTRNMFPAAKSVDEETHVLKFRLDQEIRGVRLEDDFRAEWTRLTTGRTNTVLYPAGSDALFLDRVRETQDSFQAANSARLERQFTPWLFGSGGYHYTHYDADAGFALDETFVSGGPGLARRWASPSITLDRDVHVGNLNGQLGPWDGLTATVGVQTEWSRQHGFGEASYDFEDGMGGYFLQPTTDRSDLDRATVTEHVGLRYTKVPKTVFFAEGRLQQESLGQFEERPSGDYPLRRDTDASADLLDFRGGFNTSPWRRLSLSASYRWLRKRTDYDHAVDVVPSPFGDFPGDGYSAFMRDRETQTDQVEARVVYHWSAWLKTTFSYRLVMSDYRSSVDPVTGFDPVTFLPIPGYIAPGTMALAGNYDAHVFSLNTVLRPARRVTINTTLSLHDSRSATADESLDHAPPYRGQVFSALLGGAYAMDAKTDFLLNYGFSVADYDQDTPGDSLVLGLDYQRHAVMAGLRRRLSERLSATLRYGFSLYDEPSSGGFNDYSAHSAFLTLTLRLP